MSTTPDYKATVRLPQTEFPMKGNLPTKEPQILEQWKKIGIYNRILESNTGKTDFVFPDGPPYANGSIHIGHALNKVLKDVTVKYRNLRGFRAPFVPGWDCHGLPIEHAVMKAMGDKAKEKTPEEIRDLCRKEAQKWVDTQSLQFQRLGVIADWENPYKTMDTWYEAEEIRAFAIACEKGYVYWGEKPVYWNYALQTALADAEVEYHNHKSPSIYVKFPVTDAATLAKLGSPKKPVSFLIWTTTPWTLPANLGIALNEEFKYGLYEHGDELVVVAEGLREAVSKDVGFDLKSTGFTVKGSELENLKARHPFYDRDSKIVLGEHVSLDAGTGAVHTAPGHGADDYKVGLKYNLGLLSPVGPTGTYTSEVPEYKDTHIFKANPLIIQRLKDNGRLVAHRDIEHSYPHCWRTKVPLFFRATPQWFLGLDLEGKELRPQLLKSLETFKFFPSWGEARLKAMMENRPDWCLSRQRIWGVPIPIFYCKKTGKPVIDVAVMRKVADQVEKEGLDAYYKYPPEHFMNGVKVSDPKDPDYGTSGFTHGKDILDVWFDSGVCHLAMQKKHGMRVPADIYLEGSDQHRGWFNTSLVSSMVIHGKAPFKNLLTHGFVNDAQGMKMSKSKGNTTDPNEVCSKLGADILRLWCVYEDYGQDLTIGPDILDRVTETYRRIRNTSRFLLGANFDFDPKKDAVPYEKMTDIDKWALTRLADLNTRVIAAYEEYAFYKIFHALNTFFTVDLGAIYLDVLKDRLYTWKADGLERRSSQTVIHLITEDVIRLMAPILSFLAEEVYSHHKAKDQESVFLLKLTEAPKEWKNPAIAEKFTKLLDVRAVVQKELEALRAAKTIGASLEASVEIVAPAATAELLKSFSGLREFLIVSRVDLVQSPGEGNIQVKATKAPGEKCPRCWTFSTEISTAPATLGVCAKCVDALS